LILYKNQLKIECYFCNTLEIIYVFHHIKINGIPYARSKVKGKVSGGKEWTATVIKQTKDLPKVKEACILRVTFLLPADKYPKDYPYGSDLDNLLKRFQDALNETIFSDAKGKDSCIISLTASKVKVKSNKEAGALLEIIPIEMSI
jgi:Holliday junction resolvase RusA-like endonuclease